MNAAGALASSGPAPLILLTLSILVALSTLVKMVPKALHIISVAWLAAEGFVGSKEEPGVIDTLKDQTKTLTETADRLDKVEKQLNGSGRIQPALDRLEIEVGEVRRLAEIAAVNAAEAKAAAAEALTRLHESNELSILQRGEIIKQVDALRADHKPDEAV